jgi:hypothetical protein
VGVAAFLEVGLEKGRIFARGGAGKTGEQQSVRMRLQDRTGKDVLTIV